MFNIVFHIVCWCSYCVDGWLLERCQYPMVTLHFVWLNRYHLIRDLPRVISCSSCFDLFRLCFLNISSLFIFSLIHLSFIWNWACLFINFHPFQYLINQLSISILLVYLSNTLSISLLANTAACTYMYTFSAIVCRILHAFQISTPIQGNIRRSQSQWVFDIQRTNVLTWILLYWACITNVVSHFRYWRCNHNIFIICICNLKHLYLPWWHRYHYICGFVFAFSLSSWSTCFQLKLRQLRRRDSAGFRFNIQLFLLIWVKCLIILILICMLAATIRWPYGWINILGCQIVLFGYDW